MTLFTRAATLILMQHNYYTCGIMYIIHTYTSDLYVLTQMTK